MSAQHTPGPWYWVGDSLESDRDYVIGVGDDGKSYGLHSAILIESNFATRAVANRLLLAAAPELLDALEAACSLIIAEVADGAYTEQARAARAAINKATGDKS